ncbi:DUF397 domain-containing protein [Streptomyces halobius]|uniref:DUF397 domain-containing protein n=1 Tax=Streptomyces halobius TaxID=2879846 RepID=A0ABY4M8S1_9ACTN|nr:DUF397 domain-containing protein [Streptomyces halobius]UQA92666.1 DUF397 domain-containing protein [Streptomyces halobius]
MAVRKAGVTRTHRGEPFLFSSYSRAGDECVGVAGAWTSAGVAAGAVAVLDSKDPGGPLLEFDARVWSAFLAMVKTPL